MRSPADLSSALLQVQQLLGAGRTAEAEQLSRALVSANPGSSAALNALALLLKFRGSLEEAEILMRRALAVEPRDAALHNNLGNILRDRDDRAGAEKAYRQALALNRDYPEACYNLGVVLGELGRNEEALAAQRRAVALRPAYVDALIQIAALLIGAEDFDGALSALDVVLRANPKHFGAQYYSASALMGLQRYDEAVEAARRAVALRPDSYEAQFALGNALVAALQDGEAMQAYKRAAELQPAFQPAHREYSMLAWTLGQPGKVYESYTAARSRLGDSPGLLLEEAALRLRLHDAKGAEELARRALTSDRRTDASIIVGQALTSQKRYGESVTILEDAVRAEPDLTVPRRELGIALLRAGESGKAVGVLEEAHRRAPADQLLLGFLCLAYRESGHGRYADLVDFDRFVRAYEVPADDVAAFNEALASELQQLHTRKVEPFDQTLRGGTQTAGELFASRCPQIVRLREAVLASVEDYVRALPDDETHPFLARKAAAFSFAGSWSCRLKSAGFHANHVHQQGWISSAYYVSLPGAIAQGEQGWLKFGESNLGLGERDVPACKIKPTVGKLVLFPSYYWHGTVPFTDASARLTVAFDVVPR